MQEWKSHQPMSALGLFLESFLSLCEESLPESKANKGKPSGSEEWGKEKIQIDLMTLLSPLS